MNKKYYVDPYEKKLDKIIFIGLIISFGTGFFVFSFILYYLINLFF
jgi:hypothetical protein